MTPASPTEEQVERIRKEWQSERRRLQPNQRYVRDVGHLLRVAKAAKRAEEVLSAFCKYGALRQEVAEDALAKLKEAGL